jgi:hypothetical protein
MGMVSRTCLSRKKLRFNEEKILEDDLTFVMQEFAAENKFEVKAYKMASEHEQERFALDCSLLEIHFFSRFLRNPRIVRIGLIQNSIAEDTSAPILQQYKALGQSV